MLLAALAVTAAHARPPCGTMELLPTLGPKRPLPAAPPSPGAKQ